MSVCILPRYHIVIASWGSNRWHIQEWEVKPSFLQSIRGASEGRIRGLYVAISWDRRNWKTSLLFKTIVSELLIKSAYLRTVTTMGIFWGLTKDLIFLLRTRWTFYGEVLIGTRQLRKHLWRGVIRSAITNCKWNWNTINRGFSRVGS